jgi:hypothetical protein
LNCKSPRLNLADVAIVGEAQGSVASVRIRRSRPSGKLYSTNALDQHDCTYPERTVITRKVLCHGKLMLQGLDVAHGVRSSRRRSATSSSSLKSPGGRMLQVCGYPLALEAGELMTTTVHSCPDKEGRSSCGWWQGKDKVQDQVFTLSVHSVTRRHRKGGEAEAESTTWCVCLRTSGCGVC